VLTLPPRQRCSLNRLPTSLLLLPRSGLEPSDFVRWPSRDISRIKVPRCKHAPAALLTVLSLSRITAEAGSAYLDSEQLSMEEKPCQGL